jgi:hypothetical protein
MRSISLLPAGEPNRIFLLPAVLIIWAVSRCSANFGLTVWGPDGFNPQIKQF